MKRPLLFFFIIFFVIIPKLSSAQNETLNYLIFPAPPYMIDTGQDEKLSGIDIDIVREFALRMNLKITFIRCPWKRCLCLMREGDADILSSAYKKPDREAYMIYFDTPYLNSLPIAFYTKKGKGSEIETYEDLYRLKSIGTLRGASYFPRFDRDTKIEKYEVSSQGLLLPMIINGRLDAFAGYVNTVNYRITAEGYRGMIEKSEYEYKEKAEVYFAVSKKSPLSKRIYEFNEVNSQLIREGVIPRIIQSYYQKYRGE